MDPKSLNGLQSSMGLESGNTSSSSNVSHFAGSQKLTPPSLVVLVLLVPLQTILGSWTVTAHAPTSVASYHGRVSFLLEVAYQPWIMATSGLIQRWQVNCLALRLVGGLVTGLKWYCYSVLPSDVALTLPRRIGKRDEFRLSQLPQTRCLCRNSESTFWKLFLRSSSFPLLIPIFGKELTVSAHWNVKKLTCYITWYKAGYLVNVTFYYYFHQHFWETFRTNKRII